jgi:hypothetical protein
MDRLARLALVVPLAVAGCDGFARPVVGVRPEEPPPAESQCGPTSCEALLPAPLPRWEPPDHVGAVGAACASRRSLGMTLRGQVSLRGAELRCVDLELAGEPGFELDLRDARLSGARVALDARGEGAVHLGGAALEHLDVEVRGPVELDVSGGVLRASTLRLAGEAPERLATLILDDVTASELVIDAPHGAVRQHGGTLGQARVRAVDVALEVSSAYRLTLEASELALFDADLRFVTLEVDRLIAAAGRLEDVELARCGDVTLAVVDVVRTHVARCAQPVLLDGVDAERSYFEADLVGQASLRHSALAGERVELARSRLANVVACTLAALAMDGGSLECLTCEGGPPLEVCGLPAVEHDFCPGFAASPCDAAPRPAPSGPSGGPPSGGPPSGGPPSGGL